MNYKLKKVTLTCCLFVVATFMFMSSAAAAPGDFLLEWGAKYHFSLPFGIAVDSSGNVYVSDAAPTVQKFSSDGAHLVTMQTYGYGQSGVAVDYNGNVYVVDAENYLIHKFDSSGKEVKSWGGPGVGDGQFSGILNCIAVDRSGNVYVTDGDRWDPEYQGNPLRIQVFDSEGNFLREWGSAGVGDGQFTGFTGIAVDNNDYVYVADAYAYSPRLQIFDSQGNFIRKWDVCAEHIAVDDGGNVYAGCDALVLKYDNTGTRIMTFGSRGDGDGQFAKVEGVAVDKNGHLYVVDTGLHNKIHIFDKTGALLTDWETHGTGDGEFWIPSGVAVDSNDNVFVCDLLNMTVQKFDQTGKFITKWGGPGSGNGQLAYPFGLATDSEGNVYVADTSNGRVQKFDGSGTYLATFGEQGMPTSIAVDKYSRAYVTAGANVMVFDPTGNLITSWGMPPSDKNWPYGIAVDDSGYVYIADSNFDLVRKFNSSGTPIKTWGTSGTRDGEFLAPRGITVSTGGKVYVTDKSRVQVFDNDGNFLVKLGSYGPDPGSFEGPWGVAVNSSGSRVYVADVTSRVEVFEGYDNMDAEQPAVTAFTLPITYPELTVPIINFTAVDNVAITGYLVTDSSTRPSVTGSSWTTTSPTSYTFTSYGNKTLYAWAKDDAGNISASVSATVDVVHDVTAP